MGTRFERVNPLINQKVEELFEILKPMERGDVLLLTTLDAVVGGERHEHPWGAIIGKLKKKMRDERGIILVSEMLVGYVMASADRQIGEGAVRGRRALRQIGEGVKAVAATPSGDLSLHGQRRKIGTIQALESMEKTMREQQRLQQFLSRPHESTPRLLPQGDDGDPARAVAG